MGAAAIIGLGALAASQAGNAYSENQSIKAQQSVLNSHNATMDNFNRQLQALDQKAINQQAPGAKIQDIGTQSMGVTKSLGDVANSTAAAAGAVARTTPGASSGQISSATQGAAQEGINNGILLGALQGPNRRLQDDQNRINQWRVDRGRIKNFAVGETDNVLPWQLQAAAGKGASVSGLSQLLALLGSASLASGGKTSAKPQSTGIQV